MLPAVVCGGVPGDGPCEPETVGNEQGRPAERLPRFWDNPELAHLERHLFRYPVVPYEAEPTRICLLEASTPKEEIRQTCIEIYRLLRGEEGLGQRTGAEKPEGVSVRTGEASGLHYRDIAVVTGSMETYGNDIEEEFARFGIPVYMDQTRGILFNPFTEYIRSALQIVLQDFSKDAVFHYLRIRSAREKKVEQSFCL